MMSVLSGYTEMPRGREMYGVETGSFSGSSLAFVSDLIYKIT
jgi:hypothetical protein